MQGVGGRQGGSVIRVAVHQPHNSASRHCVGHQTPASNVHSQETDYIPAAVI